MNTATHSTGSVQAKWILGIVILAVLVWVGMSISNKAPAETGPIKIGAIMALTGDSAALGQPITNGIRLAEKEINENGGIGGRPLQIIYEDGKCNGKDAASAAQKLVSVDGVKFIVGAFCSSEVFGYAPVTNAAKVLTITPGGSAPDISTLGDYVFRNSTNDGGRGVVLADYTKNNYEKIAFITEKTDYTLGQRKAFGARADEIGLQIVADEELTSDTPDYRSALTRIKATDAEVMFINVQTEATLIRIAQQARALGITLPFIASELNSPAVAAAGDFLDGTIMAVAPGLATGERATKFLSAYKEAFGEDPLYTYYTGAAYDAVYLFAQGIERYGEDTDKIKDYLYNVEYDGTIGRYSFDENGDVAGVGFVLQRLENGQFVNL